ncbi:primase-helicase family protein [Pontibacter chitinilyticus]|uniref:primase-helicase family protein n=1 Tax=Pontibacter chitinilyticus TaxID=2674989 RepID=UPI00321BF000
MKQTSTNVEQIISKPNSGQNHTSLTNRKPCNQTAFTPKQNQSRTSDNAVGIDEIEKICEEYMKVGTTYYREINIPAATPGKYLGKRLDAWTRTAIEDDYGKKAAREICNRMPKYKAFVVRPEHINYQRNIEGCYNQYDTLKYHPSEEASDFPVTESFLKHIFGDQYEIGLDYLQLLYTKPLQKLYILCLVSVERNTGKTTFLNWLRLVFCKNVTLINSEDVEGRFNSDWTSKLLVCIDETFIDSKKAAERIKSLSTTKTFKTEAKQKDKVETEFFAKFIFASNNVANFLPIDEGEIRYWVRYVKPLCSDNVNLLNELEREIPAVLYHLKKRELHTPKPLSRMWHKPEDIWTPALEVAMNGNRSRVEQLMMDAVKEYFLDFNEDLRKQGEDSSWLKLTATDIAKLMSNASGSSVRFNPSDIKKVLDKWKLTPTNSSYKFYTWIEVPDGSEGSKHVAHAANKKGRYYEIPIEKLEL